MSSPGLSSAVERNLSPAPPPLSVLSEKRQACLGVTPERVWREVPDGDGFRSPSLIRAGRWKDDHHGSREYLAADRPGFVTVEIILRRTNATLTVGGRRVHDGDATAGMAVLTPPGRQAAIVFRSPCDVLHLFVPIGRLVAIAAEAGRASALALLVQPCHPVVDPIVERLAWLLINTGEFDRDGADLYADGMAVAIIARLLHAWCGGTANEFATLEQFIRKADGGGTHPDSQTAVGHIDASELDGLRQRHNRLTPREKEVMALVVTGLMNKQVAGRLDLAEATVKIHRGKVMRKMEAQSLADLVRMAEALNVRDPTIHRFGG